MTRHAASLGSLALLAGTLFAVTTAPAPRLVHRPVPMLIAQLGSPDWTEREQAARELEQVGPAALAELRKAVAGSTDGEVLRRGGRLISRLEKRLADEKALAPTMVELNAAGQTVQEIVADLSKQTGYAVSFTSAEHRESQKLTLKTGRVSFWDAVEQLCDAGDLQIASVGTFVAPGTRIAGTPTAPRYPGLLPPVPPDAALPPKGNGAAPVDPLKGKAAAIDQLRKDLEKIATAREAVAKEANATAAERAAALAKIQAEAELKLKQAQRELAIGQAAGQGKPLPAPIAAPMPGPIAQKIQEAVEEPLRRRGRTPGDDRRNGPIDPANAIVLEPRTGAKRPSTNVGAVRLESFPLPGSAASPDAVAALVQVWAEPKVQWQQAKSLRVRQAQDDRGQALAADTNDSLVSAPIAMDGNGIQMVRNVNGNVIIINGNANGRIIVNNNNNFMLESTDRPIGSSPTGSFVPNARQIVVKLQPGGKESTVLKELAGTLESVIRTRSEAIVTIGDLSKSAEKISPFGVRLKTGEIVEGNDETYTLDVELEYNPHVIQATGPGGETNGNMPEPARMIRGGLRRLGTNGGRVIHGLSVTDEDGQPYAMAIVRQTQHMSNGTTTSLKFTLRLTPTEPGQEAPKSIAFWGNRAASVDLPFRMQDVPVLAAKK